MGAVIQGCFSGGLPISAVAPASRSGPAGALQCSGAGGGERSFPVNPSLLGVKSAGQALPAGLRPQLERVLGADLSDVRVHVGPEAARLGAVAFTMGSNIYFAPNRYQPQTSQGRQLLGHELAHVVQQRQGRVQNRTGSPLAVVQNQSLETAADRIGNRVAALPFGLPVAAPAAAGRTHPLPRRPAPRPGPPPVQCSPRRAVPPRPAFRPPRFLAAAPVLQCMVAYCQHPGCDKQARDGTNYCRSHFAVSYANMQHFGNNNPRKGAMGGTAYNSAEVSFMCEVGAGCAPLGGMVVLHPGGHAAPSGSLNYMVPAGSAIFDPGPPGGADLAAIRAATGSKASTFEGLWGRDKRPRFPVDLGNVGGVEAYGHHAKSRPNDKQLYALVWAILAVHDQHAFAGTEYVYGGDLNVDPATLTAAIENVRPGIITGVAPTMFVRRGGSTHRAGGAYDYAVTNVDPSTGQAFGHSNLRRGPDHQGYGWKF